MPRKIEITTLRTVAGSDQCTDRRTCPSVHTVADRPGRKYVILAAVTDPDELAAFASLLGPGEILGYAPDALLPEV